LDLGDRDTGERGNELTRRDILNVTFYLEHYIRPGGMSTIHALLARSAPPMTPLALQQNRERNSLGFLSLIHWTLDIAFESWRFFYFYFDIYLYYSFIQVTRYARRRKRL
jgi:hypothetical protein